MALFCLKNKKWQQSGSKEIAFDGIELKVSKWVVRNRF